MQGQSRRDSKTYMIFYFEHNVDCMVCRWWSSETIAVVTGGNRGIGFEIAHQLASHGVTVVLTSRETAVGEEAVKVFQEGGLNVAFHQLDIVEPESIQTFCDWIKETYGGLDILVYIKFIVIIEKSVYFLSSVIFVDQQCWSQFQLRQR